MSFCDPAKEPSRQEAVNIFECGDVMCDVFGFLADCPTSQHEWRRTSRAAAKWYDIAAGSYRLFPFFAISPAAEMKAASASATVTGKTNKGSGKCSSSDRGKKVTYTFFDDDNNNDDHDDKDDNVHTYNMSRGGNKGMRNRRANLFKNNNAKHSNVENTIINELHEGADGMIRRLTEQFELHIFDAQKEDKEDEKEKERGGDEKRDKSETIKDMVRGEETGDYRAESCGDTEQVEEEKKDLFWRFCPVTITRARKRDSLSSSDDDAFEYRVGGMRMDPIPHIYNYPNLSKEGRSYDAVVVPTLIINLPLLSELARKCPPESQEPPATKRNEELRKLFFEARRRGDVCGLYHVPKINSVVAATESTRSDTANKNHQDSGSSTLLGLNQTKLRPLSVTDILGLLPPNLKKKRAKILHSRDREENSGNLDLEEMVGGEDNYSTSSSSSSSSDDDDVFDPSKYGQQNAYTNNTDINSKEQQQCHHVNNENCFDDDYDQLLWFKKGFLRGINARSVYFVGGERMGKCGALFLSASPELEHIHKIGDWRNVTDLGKGFLSHCPRLRRAKFHQLSRLMSLRDETLAHCPSLRSVTFPKSVTDIGDDFLRGCGALRSFDLVDAHDLYSIGHGFLSRCSSLLKVAIRGVPKLESIGKDCLFGATSLRRLVLDTAMPTQRLMSPATTKEQQEGDMGLKKANRGGAREPSSSSSLSSSSSSSSFADDHDEDPSLPSPTDPSPLLMIEEGFLKGCPQLLDTNRRQRARELGILSRWGGVGGVGGSVFGSRGAGWQGAEGHEHGEQSREEEEGRLLFCTTNIYLAPAENRYVRSSGAVKTIYLKRSPSRSSNRAGGKRSSSSSPSVENEIAALGSSSHLRRVSHEELTGRRVTIEEETAGCAIC